MHGFATRNVIPVEAGRCGPLAWMPAFRGHDEWDQRVCRLEYNTGPH